MAVIANLLGFEVNYAIAFIGSCIAPDGTRVSAESDLEPSAVLSTKSVAVLSFLLQKRVSLSRAL
jgi:hypothetical protein